MLALAAATVHTTGVNWESVSVIIATVTALSAILMWWFDRREQARSARSQADKQQTQDAIREMGDHLTATMQLQFANLASKDTVAALSERIARVESVLKIGASGR